MVQPNFVIAGAQKSGTTYLQRCLQDHPEVFMPAEETPYFEEPDFSQIPWEQFLQEFQQAGDRRAIGIKRPDYMGRAKCAENIASRLPDIKIFFVLRNPVERAISAYFNFVGYACLPVEPINTGLKNLVSGRYVDYAVAREIIDFGFYHRLITRYYELFPKENIRIIRFEDITQNSISTFQSVYRFLGIDDQYIPKPVKSRFQVTAKSETTLRFRSLMSHVSYDYSADRSRFEPKALNEAEKYLLSFLQQIYHKLVQPHFEQEKTPVSEEIKSMLRDLYRPDIEQLEKELGWDLNDWKSAS